MNLQKTNLDKYLVPYDYQEITRRYTQLDVVIKTLEERYGGMVLLDPGTDWYVSPTAMADLGQSGMNHDDRYVYAAAYWDLFSLCTIMATHILEAMDVRIRKDLCICNDGAAYFCIQESEWGDFENDTIAVEDGDIDELYPHHDLHITFPQFGAPRYLRVRVKLEDLCMFIEFLARVNHRRNKKGLSRLAQVTGGMQAMVVRR